MNQNRQPFPTSTMRGWSMSAAVGIVLLIMIAIFVVSNSVTTIEAGTRGVLKTFGEITGVLDEGLHFRTPFITSVTVVEVRTQRYESNSSAASRDLQTVTTRLSSTIVLTPRRLIDWCARSV